MQEEVENKAVTLAINTTKMTARALKNAIDKYLNHCNQKNRGIPQGKSNSQDSPRRGKQTVKQLVGQGQGVNNIEITDRNIKSFERVARKYGVDFALKKDSSKDPPRYLVFFKAKDADALTAAFKEFTGKSVKREKKPSVLSQLRKLAEHMKTSPNKEKRKEQER
jgi:hypothetical protein